MYVCFIQVIAWVLGEFGHRSTSVTPAQLIDKLCDVIDRPHEQVVRAEAAPVACAHVMCAYTATNSVVVPRLHHEAHRAHGQ